MKFFGSRQTAVAINNLRHWYVLLHSRSFWQRLIFFQLPQLDYFVFATFDGSSPLTGRNTFAKKISSRFTGSTEEAFRKEYEEKPEGVAANVAKPALVLYVFTTVCFVASFTLDFFQHEQAKQATHKVTAVPPPTVPAVVIPPPQPVVGNQDRPAVKAPAKPKKLKTEDDKEFKGDREPVQPKARDLRSKKNAGNDNAVNDNKKPGNNYEDIMKKDTNDLHPDDWGKIFSHVVYVSFPCCW